MNANELAAELDVASSEMEYNYVVSDWKLLSDAATMLRQLSKQVGIWEKSSKDRAIKLNIAAIKISEQQKEIEALRERISYLESQLHGGTTQ